MVKIAERPYQLFFITALLLILLSLFTGKGSLDIHLNDAYYILDGVFLLRAVGMFLLLSWLLYWVSRGLMFSKILTWLHIVITILVVFFLAVMVFKSGVEHPQRYIDYTYKKTYDLSTAGQLHFIIPLCVILLFAAQLLFFINLLLGVLRRANT